MSIFVLQQVAESGYCFQACFASESVNDVMRMAFDMAQENSTVHWYTCEISGMRRGGKVILNGYSRLYIKSIDETSVFLTDGRSHERIMEIKAEDILSHDDSSGMLITRLDGVFLQLVGDIQPGKSSVIAAAKIIQGSPHDQYLIDWVLADNLGGNVTRYSHNGESYARIEAYRPE